MFRIRYIQELDTPATTCGSVSWLLQMYAISKGASF